MRVDAAFADQRCRPAVGTYLGRPAELSQPPEDDHAAEPGYLKTKIRDTLSRFFFERTKRRPMILPIVMEV